MNLTSLQMICYDNKMILGDTPFDLYEQTLFGDMEDFSEENLILLAAALAVQGLSLIHIHFEAAPCGQKGTLRLVLARDYRVISYS